MAILLNLAANQPETRLTEVRARKNDDSTEFRIYHTTLCSYQGDAPIKVQQDRKKLMEGHFNISITKRVSLENSTDLGRGAAPELKSVEFLSETLLVVEQIDIHTNFTVVGDMAPSNRFSRGRSSRQVCTPKCSVNQPLGTRHGPGLAPMRPLPRSKYAHPPAAGRHQEAVLVAYVVLP